MKKTLLLLICTLIAFPHLKVFSADINAVRVHCKSGEYVTILLDDSPVVRFDNLNLVISTDNNVVNFASEDAQKITYVSVDPDGIISPEMSDAFYSFGKESLSVNNLTSNVTVSIYTVDGRLVSSTVTDENGNATLALPSQSATLYILQTPTVSFKILRP